MILCHVTHKSLLDSIEERGLCCLFAQGKWPVVWLCREDMKPWAVKHLLKKGRGWKEEDMVVLEIRVPSRWLRPHWDGIFLHFRDVPWKWVQHVEFLDSLACCE